MAMRGPRGRHKDMATLFCAGWAVSCSVSLGRWLPLNLLQLSKQQSGRVLG